MKPNLLDIPEREIGEYYKSRWAVGRAQRMPGTNSGIELMIAFAYAREGNRQLSLYESDIPVTGDMAIGPFRIKIGIRQELKRSRPKQGPERMGTVWHSRVVGLEQMFCCPTLLGKIGMAESTSKALKELAKNHTSNYRSSL